MLRFQKLITYFSIGRKYSFQPKESVIASLKFSFNATGMNFSRNPNESFNGSSPMEKTSHVSFQISKRPNKNFDSSWVALKKKNHIYIYNKKVKTNK